MSKKTPIPTDRFSIDEVPLYKRASGITTPKEEKIESDEPNKFKKPKTAYIHNLEQCSFRLRTDQIKSLGIRHIETRENFSGMVRAALERYLSDYFEDKTANIRITFTDHETSENALETKGIRLNQKLIEGIRIVAAVNAVEKSEIVRNAIDEYLAYKIAK